MTLVAEAFRFLGCLENEFIFYFLKNDGDDSRLGPDLFVIGRGSCMLFL